MSSSGFENGCCTPMLTDLKLCYSWTALVVKGPMDLSLTGILHALTGPLGEAKVPVFASSTWDTDYVLINSGNKEKAKEALQKAGWRFSSQ